ncbi:MAG: FAD-dependent oxidoreductase [Natronomonas sp.]|uniref:NAD(P)/FAD-dependent oxidoreductase n=1 Tax=Natronomonas sp. TaxID=2184060 RepID=UPI0028705D7A|nr:FAD-dependent oxidoreductase [Natronomonas sp.]MDR9430103.1 FAD-dependent oxidoreductase [Natronomonas sp.]
MTDHYQVTVVGGGPAGLTAALYTTRLGHDTAVINRGGGRAAMMLDTHNVIGVTEETSGNEFLAAAIEQVQSYGADYFQDYVSEIEPIGTDGEGYRVTAGNVEVTTDHIVLATGFSDVRPDPPLPRTGKGLHYCLHCDAYMFVDESVFVMGTGDAAAHVAMIMLNFTPDVDVLTRGDEIEWSDETAEMLENHPIDVVHDDIVGIRKDDDGWLSAFEFEDGSVREYRGGFPMYGSNYNTDLAESLGVELNDDGTIAVDDHGRTNVDGVYAVGDITPGHNQIPTAMGEGARCGIGNHYDLRAFPRSLDEIEELGPVTDADVPAISQELLRRAVTHEGHPGGPREQQSVAGDD